ncbi:unnamed protein product, partial [Fusarium langsethiae]
MPRQDPGSLNAEISRRLLLPPRLIVMTVDSTNTIPTSSPRSLGAGNMIRREDHKYIYFESTPYTLTQPSFRHGPIALSQEMLRERTKVTDDDLDWAAFQMAIMGGAGDLVGDGQDDEDTRQLEDMTSWLSAFGFETYGALITEEAVDSVVEPMTSVRSSTASTVSSTLSIVESSLDLPIPVGA